MTGSRIDDYTEQTFHRSGLDSLPAHLEGRYGIEVSELTELDVGVFRVAVRADAPSPDVVTGKVEVDDGSRVLCSFDLRREAGRCSLRNRQLRPGTYEIVAHYVGDLYVAASRSARERLTVRP